MANPFVHLELNASDVRQAKTFYGTLFGWTFTDTEATPGTVYSVFKTDAGPGGAIMAMPGVPTMWLAYVGVADIHAATTQASQLGAQILVGPQEVPGQGWMTVLRDPVGAAVALWQPA